MSEFPWFASYPQGVPHEIDPDVYPNLSAVLDESAKKFPIMSGTPTWAPTQPMRR